MSTTSMTTGVHRRAWRFELGLLGLLAAFGILTAVVVTTPLLAIDVQIERAAQVFHPIWMDQLALAISWVGFPPESTLLDALIVAGIFLAGSRWAAASAALAAAGSAGLWFLIAPLVHRPRPSPDLVRVFAEIPYGGFPSGHVVNLTAFFGFLAFLAWAVLKPGWVRRMCLVVCCALVVSIGYARVYSGEHWPTDALAGYVLGATWLWITVRVYRWGGRRGWR